MIFKGMCPVPTIENDRSNTQGNILSTTSILKDLTANELILDQMKCLYNRISEVAFGNMFTFIAFDDQFFSPA